MKKKLRKVIWDEEGHMDVSSLIDVCFLLLIYFLVTSTIVKREQDLDMRLPGHGVGAPAGEPLVVHVESDGEIILNPNQSPESIAAAGSASRLEVLAERIRFLRAAQGSQAMVHLFVSHEVDYQRFIDVINCLAGEGIEHLAVNDLSE